MVRPEACAHGTEIRLCETEMAGTSLSARWVCDMMYMTVHRGEGYSGVPYGDPVGSETVDGYVFTDLRISPPPSPSRRPTRGRGSMNQVVAGPVTMWRETVETGLWREAE